MAESFQDKGCAWKVTVKSIILIFVSLFAAQSLSGCFIVRNRPSFEKDGKQYGVTSGAFRHRYWNYYERGLSYTEGEFWKEAEDDFKAAIKKRDSDSLRSRTYGLHFIEYLPHRELGINLFHQANYSEAIQELEVSLSHETTSRAQFFLDKARKAWLETSRIDIGLPEIICDVPKGEDLVNRSKIVVSGVAKDDTFVKKIVINGIAVPIDLSAPEISFKTDVPVRLGENSIIIEVTDLIGKTSKSEKIVWCDRLGPVLSIYEPVPSATKDNTYFIKAYAGDDYGLKTITLNGRNILKTQVPGVVFGCPVTLAPGENKAVISAEDQAGNITTAEVFLTGFRNEAIADCFQGPLLASLDIPPYLLAGINSDSRGGISVSSGLKNHEEARGGAIVSQASNPEAGQSNNYALIIGIDAYEEWTPLKTAVNDARALKKVLVDRYEFHEENIQLITDKEATRSVLIDALMQMTSGLGDSDNLLIYFAGHGQLSNHANDGYWIPVEGKRGKSVWSWIAHSAVKNIIISEEIRASNIVVIADSCYGGKLTRGGGAGGSSETIIPAKLLELCLKKSRQIITSGSLEPVADWGRENHSLFAWYLLKGLKENTQPAIDLKSLVNAYVWEPVFRISGQRPVVGRFKTPMDEDGEFVLFLKKGDGGSVVVRKTESPVFNRGTAQRNSGDTSSPEIDIKTLKNNHTVFLDHIYLEGRVTDESSVQAVRINGRNVLKWPGRTIHFQHLAELKEGDNPFIIECVDKAGNTARKELHIYRKVRKMHEDAARMTAALFPLEISGAPGMDIDSMLFDTLFDCDRFNMKQWKGALPVKEMYDISKMSSLAKDQDLDFFLTGTAKVWGNSLEIRVRVVETETLDIVTMADVFNEGTDRSIFDSMCRGLLCKIRHSLPIVEGKVARINGDRVIVNLGETQGVRKGMHLVFFEEGEPVSDPETGEILGMDTRHLGTARINKVLSKMSHAEIIGEKEVVAELRVGHPVITK